MTSFRERVKSAIEAHEPLDTAEFHRLSHAADDVDRSNWRQQIQLDRAIAAWKVQRPRRSPATTVRRAAAILSVTGASIATGWLAVPTSWSTPIREEAVPNRPRAIAPAPEFQAATAPVVSRSTEPTLAQHPLTSEQFAEAAATAGRLAYAFEPVGERVGTVVRFLVDSVPGSEVFAM